jgi:hypothetical protein
MLTLSKFSLFLQVSSIKTLYTFLLSPICVLYVKQVAVLRTLSFYIKAKAVPLQAWSGPECSRKLRFLDIMIPGQDGGKVDSLWHRPPLPQHIHLVLISFRG